jgi:hypothetical protein
MAIGNALALNLETSKRSMKKSDVLKDLTVISHKFFLWLFQLHAIFPPPFLLSSLYRNLK